MQDAVDKGVEEERERLMAREREIEAKHMEHEKRLEAELKHTKDLLQDVEKNVQVWIYCARFYSLSVPAYQLRVLYLCHCTFIKGLEYKVEETKAKGAKIIIVEAEANMQEVVIQSV